MQGTEKRKNLNRIEHDLENEGGSTINEKNIDLVDTSIQLLGWFHFGKKEFECIGLHEESLDFFKRNNQLPHPCNTCYKALIFWNDTSKGNLVNFFKMLDSFEVNYRGKLNKDVVVFYFRKKEKMLKFLDSLQSKMKEFNVNGRTQWRRACKEFQDLKPELWKNAKEFIPEMETAKSTKGFQQTL